jgi:neutral ceramidase
MKAIIAIAAILAGCSGSPNTVATSPRKGPAPIAALGRVDVGTARADLTPPPGPSTFGHAPDSHVANGYWTRIYCRVFYMKPEHGLPVAIVPCDLAAVGAALRDAVARRVVDVVEPSRLMLSATHTHAGPAHYFESSAYGGATSTRLPGFDPKMLESLADRIAVAVHRAALPTTLRPASMHWSQSDEWCLSRNRSLTAYRGNSIHPDFRAPGKCENGDPLTDDQKAVDPSLEVLQIDEVDAATRTARVGPIGLLSFFAMHPTVLPSQNRLFGGDVFGVASRALESEMRRAWARTPACKPGAATGLGPCRVGAGLDPLAGIINTNEGDLVPIWSLGTVDETIAVGRDLAARIWKNYDEGAPIASGHVIDARYLEAYMPSAPLVRGGTLCKRGELGTGTGHGGSDHRATLDSVIPSGPDTDPTRKDCQAPKHRLLGTIQKWLVGIRPDSYPAEVSFSLVRIDDRYVSFVPAEMTLHAGASVNQRVKGIVCGAGACTAHFVIGGLTNAYIQYVSTWAEYQYQYYEASSTLYGPRSAEYFGDRMEVLARAMQSPASEPAVDQFREKSFSFAPVRKRLPDSDAGSPLEEIENRGVMSACSIERSPKPVLCLRWRDGAPGRLPLGADRLEPWLELAVVPKGQSARRARSCGWPLKSAGPEPGCDPGGAIDDRGTDFEVRVTARDGDAFSWVALFHPSEAEWKALDPKEPVAVRALGGAALPVTTEPFWPTEPPCECSPEVMRQCLGN